MRSQETGSVIDKNISSIHSLKASFDQGRPKSAKLIDKLAGFFGTTTGLYLHLLIYGGWLIWAIFKAHGSLSDSHIDRISFVASLEAIFLAIFVLINQRHMNFIESKSADLHLQMSLLAEHKVTRILSLTIAIAEKLEVKSEKAGRQPDETEKRPEEIIGKLVAEEER